MLASPSGEGLMRYRDKLTEGYSVTPNFFIRGELPAYEKESQFKEPYFRENPDTQNEDLIKKDDVDLWDIRNRHFRNRLFDRDTLLLLVYNVNFLYVLKAYTSKRSSLREEFKRDARKKFRENFLTLLDEKYYFWALFTKPQTIDKVNAFVESNFKKLVGRVFRPDESSEYLILALEKSSVGNSDKDYLEIRNAVSDADIEVFYVKAQELWADESLVEHLRHNPGWGPSEQ